MPRNRRVGDRPPPSVRIAFAAVLTGYAFALQFATPHLGSLDAYYHIRYSAALANAGWRNFPPLFAALPLTILSADRYYDHHLLFHLWLVFFTHGDLIFGAKLAAALGAAGAFLSAYGLLLWRRVRRAEWWSVALLAVAPGFLYRMEMPRAQAWGVVWLMVALALLFRGRSRWLVPVACTFTWVYDGFPAILALAAAAMVAHWLLRGTVLWQPLAAAAGGIVLGLVANPYFPRNLSFIAAHYADKLRLDDAVRVGSEWYPLPLFEWLGWGGLVAVLVAVAALLYRQRAALDADRLTAALAAMIFFSLFWRSARFLEYAVPFGAVALAFLFHHPADELVRKLARHRRRWLAAALVAWLVASTVIAAVHLRRRPPASRYRAASAWIASHTPPGSLIFNTDWDDFPLLYFHNPANAYVIGLDPTYLARRDRMRYEAWRRISDGEEVEPARAIRTQFGARVAFTDRRHDRFIAAMDRDPLAQRAYEDEDGIVYELQE